jgi:AcrR family transcriptional regulator
MEEPVFSRIFFLFTTRVTADREKPVALGLMSAPRRRMSSAERRSQLIEVSRAIFAEKGVEGATVEEIAAAAKVSKPVIYEHFGGKEGLYAVVVDREMAALLNLITSSLTTGRPRARAEQAAIAFLTYIETRSDGFQILVRDSTVGAQSGSFATLISDIASQVENIFVAEFAARGFDPKMAPMYSQMLVGMVALTGQWWLDTRWPSRDVVAAHLVNLAWNGLSSLESKPEMSSSKKLNKDKKVTKKK